MTVVTWDAFRAAEHFTMRSARLIDRHRFAYHFQNGPAAPIRSALAAYRNLDGGYGNGLDPDMRGHASQPAATELALAHLDELGPIPHNIGSGICRYLTSISGPEGNIPHALPTIRNTEAAPWLQTGEPYISSLGATAAITAYLHKHRITHPWRDLATAYCWKHIDSMGWTHPEEAIRICHFLQHAPNRPRALQAINRLSAIIRAEFDEYPTPDSRTHTPLDLAPSPDHIARPLFTQTVIAHNLDTFQRQQRPDGGWDSHHDTWDPAATIEREGMLTIQRLRVLRAYGRIGTRLPTPRTDP